MPYPIYLKMNWLSNIMSNKFKIWITKKAIDMSQDALRNVVFHEIVHAVTGFEHDEKCPLMKSTLDGYLLNKTECIKYLKGYIKQGAAILSLQSMG